MAEIIVPDTIRVLMPNGRVSPMKLETYLAGAVAMAIGATSPLEVLKAQAVASRTYAARAKRHAEQYADVCVNAHCQKWKRVDPIVAPDVFRAVSETWGVVAAFNGELIDIFFFENCAGKTRGAEEMAMPSQPYLRGVECPCGFTEMKGHGVGMCQRGAIVMARQGATFKDILSHYFTGVEILQMRADAPSAAPSETPAAKKAHSANPKKTSASKVAPAASPPDEFSALLQSLNEAVGMAPSPTPTANPSPASRGGESVPPKSKPGIEKPQAPAPPAPVPAPASKAEEISLPAQPAPIEVTPEPETPPAPALPPLGVIHVDNLPGPRMIAGCLSRAGVEIDIEDPRGWKMKVYSGSTAHYGEGGFEVLSLANGFYTVHIEEKTIEVNLREETIFLREEDAA